MQKLTKQMIEKYRIKDLGYDMMGYSPMVGDICEFHHLIIPRRIFRQYDMGDGYYEWNGALLFTTPHEYLHLIEAKDLDIYYAINDEMLDMKIKGYIAKENLKYIDDCLDQFEREHCVDKNKFGKQLIKDEYLQRNHFML